MADNGNKETEHPKPSIEVLANTHDSILSYAAAKGIPEEQAALILILNELRCIHWHLDAIMAKEEARK